jgi:hypothetical protein
MTDTNVPPKDYERLLEERRERERQRKRKFRKQQTPKQRRRERSRKRKARKRLSLEQRQREATRKRVARLHQTPEQREREKERLHCRSRQRQRSFMAIDGEGGGTDYLGRQNYLLMAAAGPTGEPYRLHRDGKPLSVSDCLEFVLSLPAEPILVGFYFGYDVTQILRGIGKAPTLRRILDPRQGRNGPCYTYWGDYAILYQQGQYFRVARIDRSGPKPAVIKGSTRTVYEAFGFFQCSFVDAIEKWKIGSEDERAVIAKNKGLRDEFSELTREIVEYCELECRHLAMLMTELRGVCIAAGIVPKQWSGAGWLAAALLAKYGVPKRPLTAREIAALDEKKPCRNAKPASPRRPERDREFEIAANLGYYGGRFEVSRNGFIRGRVYQNDLHSAYAAQMPKLPCPLHTGWVHRPHARHLPKDGLYLAKITFVHPPDNLWCGLPFRRDGSLFWPLQGTGWYWSPEIEAAQRCLGADVIKVHDLWVARCACDCRFYDWVLDLYDERRRIGSSTRGYPLKLGLASLYGKTAQRSGRGPHHDPVAAGLITAMARALLIEAIAKDPKAVVMVATDAVFSTRPLPLDIGEGLGQWELKIWPDLFIAQPGVYWSPSELEKSVKSRGVRRSVISSAAPRFQQVFSTWAELLRRPGALELMLKERQLIPSVPVTVRVFYGCRLALARNKPWLAGRWKNETRYESFEWGTKRDPMRVRLDDDGCLVTFPLSISPFAESKGYEPADFDRLIVIAGVGGDTETIDETMLLEAMPDFTPFLPHE